MCDHALVFFCKHLYSMEFYKFQKSTILTEIVGFLKTAIKLQLIAQNLSRKSNLDMILHYISLPIYQLNFPKFCPIQKQ